MGLYTQLSAALCEYGCFANGDETLNLCDRNTAAAAEPLACSPPAGPSTLNFMSLAFTRKEQNRKEKVMLLSDHDGSLLRRQPKVLTWIQ